MPGSGKSTFSKKLSKSLDIHLHHLDKYRWRHDDRGNWIKIDDDEVLDRHTNIIKEERYWIIDGNYIETMEDRFNAADLIIHYNCSIYKSLWRIFKRRLKGESININWGFIKYVFKYNSLIKPIIYKFRSDVRYIKIDV